jgi:hypothetical protein
VTLNCSGETLAVGATLPGADRHDTPFHAKSAQVLKPATFDFGMALGPWHLGKAYGERLPLTTTVGWKLLAAWAVGMLD